MYTNTQVLSITQFSGPMEGLQSKLFEELKQTIPKNISLVDEVAEVLDVSLDSAYRRLRGEKQLTFTEMLLLSKRFDFSIDSILNQASNRFVQFSFPELHYDESNFFKYYENIEIDLKLIASSKESRIIYCANDISLFHILQIPIISAFKSYFWLKTTFGFKSLEGKKFSKSMISTYETPQMKSVLKQYTQIPCTEILNSGIINSTLNQIHFCQLSGYFEEKDLYEELLNGLKELVNLLKEQAEKGQQKLHANKDHEGAVYQLYMNDVILSDNTILVEHGDDKFAYISCNATNYLKTHDKNFTSITSQYLKSLIAKSQLISSSSELERNKYFNTLESKIEEFQRA